MGIYSEQKGVTAVNMEYCPYCMTPLGEGGVCPNCGLTSGAYFPLPHHLPPGTVLMDRYLVGRMLGEGGFGITYIGCDLRLELKVAIKEYFPTNWVARHSAASLNVSSYAGASGSFEKGKSRFLYEARTMAKMDKQPEIVSVRDFFELNNTAYIVMEYVDGTTFKELVAQRGGRIPAKELLRMIEPLFSALSAVHEAGLIHRDISPDNLMLERGSVRLLDFGCARESTQGTETMTITLKHGYAPIEQYQHKGQGPWTDVYGLSATIYYCITGKTPPQALDRLMDDEIILPRKLGVDLTEKQEKALLHGMGIKQHQRYRTIEELHTALYEDEEQEKPHVPGPGPAQKTEPERKTEPVQSGKQKNKRQAVAGAVAGSLLLICILLAAILSGTGKQETEPDVTWSPSDEMTVNNTWTGPDRDELFANAAVATDGAMLRELLSDSSVEAVAASGDIWLDSAIELTKPLLVDEGSKLGARGLFRLKSGAVLWTQGQLNSDVYVEDGSVVGDESSIINGNIIVTEGVGSAYISGEHYGAKLSLMSDPSFENAVTVSSLKELSVACSGGAESIRVKGNIELTEDLYSSVPILVEKGARISTADGAEDAALMLEGTALVNNGSLDCGLWFEGEQCELLNRGVLRTGNGLWMKGGDCYIVNTGELFFEEYNAMWGDVYNLGSITSSKGSLEYGTVGYDQAVFRNYGSFKVSADCSLIVGGELNNYGTMDVEGSLENYGSIYSGGGELNLLRGAVCENRGLLDYYDGYILNIEDGAQLRTEDGVFVTRSNYTNITGEIEGKCWEADFTLIDGPDIHVVTSEDELMAALSDPSIEAVRIDKDIELSGSLVVTKPVFVYYDACLSLPEGEAVVVEGSLFVVNGKLCCDVIEVCNAGMVELISGWTGSGDGTRMSLSGGSWAYTRISGLNAAELDLIEGSMAVYANSNNGMQESSLKRVSLSDDSFLVLNGERVSSDELDIDLSESVMIQLGDVALAGASDIELADGSTYAQFGSMSIFDGAKVGIRADSSFDSYGGLLNIGTDGSLKNEGILSALNFSDINSILISGECENSGELYLSCRIELSGSLVNTGSISSIYKDPDEALVLREGSTFESESSIGAWN